MRRRRLEVRLADVQVVDVDAALLRASSASGISLRIGEAGIRRARFEMGGVMGSHCSRSPWGGGSPLEWRRHRQRQPGRAGGAGRRSLLRDLEAGRLCRLRRRRADRHSHRGQRGGLRGHRLRATRWPTTSGSASCWTSEWPSSGSPKVTLLATGPDRRRRGVPGGPDSRGSEVQRRRAAFPLLPGDLLGDLGEAQLTAARLPQVPTNIAL